MGTEPFVLQADGLLTYAIPPERGVLVVVWVVKKKKR